MRKKNMNEPYPIDFVVMWVDGSDPAWLSKKKKFKPDLDIADEKERYRDWGIFKYWFRSIEENAPWVNHVYLVTDNQIPEWLNIDNPKLTIVDHEEIIDRKYLPTFNSQAIESNIHNINGLSEHFVLFNDDTFLGAPVKPDDFFHKGMPREIANINPLSGMGKDELYANTIFNNTLIANRHFNKNEVIKKSFARWLNVKYGAYNLRTLTQLPFPYFTGYKPPHLPTSFLKSTFEKVWNAEYEQLLRTTSHKFRSPSDTNQNIFTIWQLCEGNFYPKNVHSTRFVEIRNDDIRKCIKIIRSSKIKQFCINDKYEGNSYKKLSLILCSEFSKRYPNRSSFERGNK